MGQLFPGVVVVCLVIAGGVSSDHYTRRHINSVALFKPSSSPGCLKKPHTNVFLLGPANACTAKKPLKLTSVLKMGKQLCAVDWKICDNKDKPVSQLSWKGHKMPSGCFAFNYGKKKAAGYGQHCRANLYFDGVLCCPVPNTKADHYLNTKAPKKVSLHPHQQLINRQDINLNLLKK